MNLSDTGIHYFLLSYFSSLLLLALCLWQTIHRRRFTVRTCLWLFSALLPFIWFCQGNGFGHYGMTVFPLFAIAMIEMSELRLRTLTICVIATMIVACATQSKSYISVEVFHLSCHHHSGFHRCRSGGNVGCKHFLLRAVDVE